MPSEPLVDDSEYRLETGYEPVTNSYLRVVEKSTGTIVSYLDKDGYNGNITGGTINTEVIIPGVDRTISVNPTISKNGFANEFKVSNGGFIQNSGDSDLYAYLRLPNSSPSASQGYAVYPLGINDELVLDRPHIGDYRELRFMKKSFGSSNRPLSTYYGYCHGSIGSDLGVSGYELAFNGFGIYFNPDDSTWYLYCATNVFPYVDQVSVDELITTSAQEIMITYTGTAARGGTDRLNLDINRVQVASMPVTAGLSLGSASAIFGMYATCNSTSDAGTGIGIYTGGFKFYSALPTDIFGP